MNRSIVLFTALTLAACGSTSSDSVGLHYNGGPIEGESFEGMVEPGSGQKFLGPGDNIIRLPINQRDYTACSAVRKGDQEGCDGSPIRVAARGGAELDISLGVTFEINSGDEKILRQFYEQICKKFDCLGDKGWDEMLRVNFRGPIEQAVQQKVRDFTVNELFAGVPAEGESDKEAAVSTLDQVQKALADDLKENINSFVGGDYFCGPGYERSKPKECPNFVFQITDVSPVDDGVREAFAKNVSSAQDVVTARNQAEAQLAEAVGESEAARILAEVASIPGYVDYLRVLAAQACANNPKCTLIISDGTANVNVNAGG